MPSPDAVSTWWQQALQRQLSQQSPPGGTQPPPTAAPAADTRSKSAIRRSKLTDKIKKQLAAHVIGTCAAEISESEYDAIGAAAVRADDAPHELWKHIEGLQKMVNTVNKMKDWHPPKPDDLVSAAGRPPK